jgi:hypothetical protein
MVGLKVDFMKIGVFCFSFALSRYYTPLSGRLPLNNQYKTGIKGRRFRALASDPAKTPILRVGMPYKESCCYA